jgi:Rieske Fe-S protein
MTISRRVFLRTTAACGATAAALGSVGLGCGNNVQPAPPAVVFVDDDPLSSLYGQIAVAPWVYPDLVPVGGAITLRVAPLSPRPRPFEVPTAGILLIHRCSAADPPEYVALGASCPHLGCPLGYSARDRLVECPCHGSRFRAVCDPGDLSSGAGAVVHGPARDGLSGWPVSVASDGTLLIDLNSAESCAPPWPDAADGKVTLSLRDYPELATVGGSLVGKPKGIADKLIVIRADENEVVVLSDICTHMGCGVEYAQASRDIQCPCHGSSFNLEGGVTGGPAPAPLRKYMSSFDGSTVTIVVA